MDGWFIEGYNINDKFILILEKEIKEIKSEQMKIRRKILDLDNNDFKIKKNEEEKNYAVPII